MGVSMTSSNSAFTRGPWSAAINRRFFGVRRFIAAFLFKKSGDESPHSKEKKAAMNRRTPKKAAMNRRTPKKSGDKSPHSKKSGDESPHSKKASPCRAAGVVRITNPGRR